MTSFRGCATCAGVLLLLCVLCSCAAGAGSKRLVAYVDGMNSWWGTPVLTNLGVPGYANTPYTHILLAFFSCSQNAGVDAALAWANPALYVGTDAMKSVSGSTDKGTFQQYVMGLYHNAGKKLMVSAFGATEFPTTAGLDPTVCADRLAAFVQQNHLDGADVDWEDNDAMNIGTGEAWIVTFQTELRAKLGGGYLISHAPQGPYFKSNPQYPHGAYLAVHSSVGSTIDWYNIQYYNQGSTITYDTYALLFQSSPGATAVAELIAKGFPADKLVVGKPITPADASNTGYVSVSTLGSICSSAMADSSLSGWQAGFMGWQLKSDAANSYSFGTTLASCLGTAPNPGTCTNFNTATGYDFPNSDIRSFSTSSITDCYNACNQDSNCGGVVLHDNTCWLKTAAAFTAANEIVRAGSVVGRCGGFGLGHCATYQTLTGVDYPFSDITSFACTSMDLCMKTCDLQQNCQGAVMHDGTCWLKTASAFAASNQQSRAGSTVGICGSGGGCSSMTQLSTIDLFGADVANAAASNIDACIALCQANSNCQAATLSGGVCYMKSAAALADQKYCAGCVSAYCAGTDHCPGWTTVAGTDLFGGDIANAAASSISDCLPLCKANPQCVAATFFNGVCYLKNEASVAGVKTCSGCTSGKCGGNLVAAQAAKLKLDATATDTKVDASGTKSK